MYSDENVPIFGGRELVVIFSQGKENGGKQLAMMRAHLVSRH